MKHQSITSLRAERKLHYAKGGHDLHVADEKLILALSRRIRQLNDAQREIVAARKLSQNVE